jgi:hypothetical protein
MSLNTPITAEDRWFRYETKLIEFTCVDPAGDPLNLSARTVRWIISATPGSAILLSKTTVSGIAVAGASSNIARVTVDQGDYANLPAGVYHHELWDMTEEVLLASGIAVIRAATDPSTP